MKYYAFFAYIFVKEKRDNILFFWPEITKKGNLKYTLILLKLCIVAKYYYNLKFIVYIAHENIVKIAIGVHSKSDIYKFKHGRTAIFTSGRDSVR